MTNEGVGTVDDWCVLTLGYAKRPSVASAMGSPITFSQLAQSPAPWLMLTSYIKAGRATTCASLRRIFGPVIAVIPYGDVDDAVRLANDSEFGKEGLEGYLELKSIVPPGFGVAAAG